MPDAREWWNTNPCEAWHSECLPGSYYWSDDVTRWRYRVQPHISNFAGFERWKGRRILDIGCGVGTDAIEFAKSGAEVVAIDFSQESIRLARTRLFTKDLRVEFSVVGNAEDFLPEEKFDLIWAFGSLHHMQHPEKCLALIRQRLAPGGTLKLMVYATWSLKFLTGTRPEAAPGCPHVRTYTATGIRHLVESVGLVVHKIEKAHVFPYGIKAYQQHRLTRKWPYSWMSDTSLERLGRVAGHHLLVTAGL